jgi:hypothetical protein
MVYRENNPEKSFKFETWLPSKGKVTCKLILGSGKDFKAITGEKGTLMFPIKKPLGFAL